MKLNNDDEQLDKLVRLRELMIQRNLDACILRRTASLAWIRAGARTYVNTANGEGPVSAIITADRHCILTNEIEYPRLRDEEHMERAGWEVFVDPWYRPATPVADRLEALGVHRTDARIGYDGVPDTQGMTDVSIGAQIARLRSRLCPAERTRAAALGADCAEAMLDACTDVQPGQTEQEIAASIWTHTQRRGVQAIVNLVACDERIHRYRHPLPTENRLQRHAMLVLSGRRQGLVVSMTRIMHFGQPPDEIRARQRAVASVDAAMIGASVPGATTGRVFDRARDAYAAAGYPDAWRDHHQGGVAGYEPREFLALPDAGDILADGMLCSWNPSLPGTKSEDTILVDSNGPHVLTATVGWPEIHAHDPETGVTITRPDILIR